MKLWTKEDLDEEAAQPCSTPGCTNPKCKEGLLLDSACSGGTLVVAEYKKGSGVVHLRCPGCGRVEWAIKVAEKKIKLNDRELNFAE